jgi:hypothetical protein
MPWKIWDLWIKGERSGINDIRIKGKMTSGSILENINSVE